MWSVAFVLCFAVLARLAGSSRDRRSYFWVRALFLAVGPASIPMLLAAGEKLGVFPRGTLQTFGPWTAFACVLSLIVMPASLYRRSGASPGDSDDDGGSGPQPPPDAPDPPGGGIPLPDAEQSPARVRDHNGARRRWRRVRRATREPRRTPV